MLLLEAIRILSMVSSSMNVTASGNDGNDDRSYRHHKRRRRQKNYHTFLRDLDNKTNSSCSSSGDNNNYESALLLIPGLPNDIALNCLALARRSDHLALACLNTRFNSLLNSGYLYNLRRQMGISEHWVYLVCDLGGWDAFDPAAKRWMRLPKIPCDDCFNYADKESLAVGSRLLVFGRELSEFAVWNYSGIVNSGWARSRPMNLPRCLFASGSSGSIAIVAGGTDKAGAVLQSAELYNSETDQWELLPNMHCPRKLCSGFFMDGKFYVIGGMTGKKTPLTCGEEFDLMSRTWKRIEGMYPTVSKVTGAPPLVAVVDNQLYAVEHHSNMVKRYNKERNSWTVIGRLPVRADTSNGWGLAFKACGNELLVVGGQRGIDGESIMLSSWRPGECSSNTEVPDWNVLGIKEHTGVFIYNCAVMGC